MHYVPIKYISMSYFMNLIINISSIVHINLD